MNQEPPVIILNDEGLRAVLVHLLGAIWGWGDKRFTRAEYTAPYYECREGFSALLFALEKACDWIPEGMPAVMFESPAAATP